MPSIVNIRFKVTRVDHGGNRRDPYSRLFVLESVDLEKPFQNYPNTIGFAKFIAKIKNEFPETAGNARSKLVTPGTSLFLFLIVRNSV